MLHPQDVCVVLKCIVGVFSRPLGVVTFPVCVFGWLCVCSPSSSHTLCLFGNYKLPTGGAHQGVCCRRVATKEQREQCLERFTSPLLQTCWVFPLKDMLIVVQNGYLLNDKF